MTGYEALADAAARIDLTGRPLIRVTGEDRARLLHAMSTNDIKALRPGDHCQAFFLSAQGRILAEAWVLCREEEFLLDTAAPGLLAHLDKFIIADDVTLEDVSAAYAVTAIEGPAATLPELPEGAFAAPLALTGPVGYRVWHAPGWIPANLPLATAEEAELVRIENGVPRFGTELGEKFLVQETLQMQAVSFAKGCYLGQEIVERVRARGAVHKHLASFEIDAPSPPPGEAEIFAGETKAGFVTSAAYSPRRGCVVAMGYVNVVFESGAKPLSLGQNGPAVRLVRPHAGQ